MLVVMKPTASEEEIRAVCEKIQAMGFRAHPMPGAQRTAIGITGNPGPLDPELFEGMAGVAEAIRVSKPYKLVSREIRDEDSLVRVGDEGLVVGGRSLRSSPGLAPSRAATRLFAPQSVLSALEHGCFAVAPSSHVPRLTAFRGWAKRGWRFSAKSASTSGC